MISREEIQNLAELARLKLTDAEVSALQKDISAVLDYIGQVTAAAQGAAASYTPLRNVLRADTPRAADDLFANKREALLRAMPRREGDYAVARQIIEK